VFVDVDDAWGDLGLPPPRNRDEHDEEKMLNSFGGRQLQPMSTTGGCRSEKRRPPLLLDDLPADILDANVCVRACGRTHTERS
jgi:hypothetical protein